MGKMWKSMLGIALVAAVSAGVSVGTYSYMNEKNESAVTAVTGGFRQPLKLAAYTASAAENTDFTAAAENAVHGVVHIKATTSVKEGTQRQQQPQYIDPFEFFFGDRSGNGFRRPQSQQVGYGSGVIISTDGYILTNNHVVTNDNVPGGVTELEITLNDGRKFTGKLVGADETTDIALVKIDADNLSVIPFGDSEKLKVGEWVLAVGNPFNLTSTVTAGIVSAKGRGISGMQPGGNMRSKIESFIQTDAAVNPGNSGGALINTKGELIGINTAIYSQTGNYAGYSFAVPMSIAGKVANDLKQYGAVQRAVLGVIIQDLGNMAPEEKSKLKVYEGVYVADFSDFSSAKEAGIEKGDVITYVNGVKVKNLNELQEQISKYRPGDTCEITVDRNGKSKNYTVKFRNRQGNTEIVKGDVGANVLGATFKMLTDEQKREYGVNYGIEVVSVSNGKFREAGIKKGFVIMVVNDNRIASPDDLDRIVKDIMAGNSEDQGLFIKGFYGNGSVKHYAIDLM